ncbi:MAG: transcriptional regulator NrdR [Peptococcaceae bacterium]|nr:transcriptional regulator NrdR [Peptococcaceae bacterium]
MKCPHCDCTDSRVVDSRPTAEESAIRRRRECPNCFRRFTTYERAEEQPLVVIKKDGSRELFSRSKILAGLLKACEKRPVSLEVLEDAVLEIESKLMNEVRSEVPSARIGELVMERLRGIDEVAYVRFASVYRQFTDINNFLFELEKLFKVRSQ